MEYLKTHHSNVTSNRFMPTRKTSFNRIANSVNKERRGKEKRGEESGEKERRTYLHYNTDKYSFYELLKLGASIHLNKTL